MLITDFYIYIFLALAWLIYIANTLYQNYKMRHFFPDKMKEMLSIPFYVFTFTLSMIVEYRLLTINSKATIINISSSIDAIKLIGVLSCLASVVFFTYLNFFEKSFPSCNAIKNGGKLKGIYNYIRHPSYYVSFFITFGTAFSLLSFLLFVLACINHTCLYFYYIIEENELKEKNSYYKEYLKKTKRFFPVFPGFGT